MMASPPHHLHHFPCERPGFSPSQISPALDGRKLPLWPPKCCAARPLLIGRRKAGNYSRLGRDVSGLSLFSNHFPDAPRWGQFKARLSRSLFKPVHVHQRRALHLR